MNCDGLTGRVIGPDDPAYEQARQDYNTAISQYPLLIVYCTAERDIANAILWSRRQGIPLRVRSGGHDYAGYSNGSGTLVIDTSLMNKITVNKRKGTAMVQAGVRLLPLYERLYRYGFGFPGGTCPTVAISGLVLGGGIGLSSRCLGLTADNLLQATLIDFAGRELTADSETHADLFWALRGAGGGNFGVASSYTFRLPRVSDVSVIQLRWDNSLAARNQFLPLWQEWLPGLDRRLSAFGGIYQQGAWLNAFCYGEEATARTLLQPFLNLTGLTLQRIEYVPFIDAVKIIGAIYPRQESFQAAGRFVHRQLSQTELANLIAVIEQAPDARDSSLRVYSLGGAVWDIAAAATAFAYRQADYILAVASSWQMPAEASLHRQWVRDGFDYLATISRGSYVNFPYSQTPNYQQAYYGGNLCRLQAVKQAYDPCNVFRFPQSIQLPR